MPSNFRINWRGADVFQEKTRITFRNMTAAVANIEGKAKALLNRTQPKARTKSGGVRGLGPSEPGEPPKILQGTLRANVGSEVQTKVTGIGSLRIIGLVGVKEGPANAYAARQEFGFVGTDSRGRTIDQAPRPFLRAAVFEEKAATARTLGAGL